MVLVSEQDKGVEEAEEDTRKSECRGVYCCCMKINLKLLKINLKAFLFENFKILICSKL